MPFHQDNTPVHMPSQVLVAIRSARFELLCHPSHSPEVAPIDFYLSPKQKEFMKECKFTDNEDVICAKNGCLAEHDQKFFYNGIRAFEKHEKHVTKCIPVADYVEK